jgi:Family of unknown function (DUF6339)
MTMRILRDAAVASFRRSVRENLDRYRDGDFSFIDLDPTFWIELKVDASDAALHTLMLPSGGEDYEVENCMAVYDYLPSLTLYDARDERLWSYLTHTLFLEYARARWPIPADDDKAVAHIQTHFFARSHRQVERDNAVSRLWWMAHLCTRVQSVDQREALQAFLFRSDVRANIIERPTVAQSTGVFSMILRSLVQSYSGKRALFERLTFRKVMMELNSIGGFKLLDALPDPELNKVFSEVSQRVGLTAL